MFPKTINFTIFCYKWILNFLDFFQRKIKKTKGDRKMKKESEKQEQEKQKQEMQENKEKRNCEFLKKKSHGGKRKNSGRKKKSETEKAVKFLGYTCTKEEKNIMQQKFKEFKEKNNFNTSQAFRKIFLEMI